MSKRRHRHRREPTPTVEYRDDEGNAITLRRELSPGTIEQIAAGPARPATSAEDSHARREEMLFERLVVRWEIAGLPLDEPKMLLGRYRMADSEERDWVRRTIAAHVERYLPELAP